LKYYNIATQAYRLDADAGSLSVPRCGDVHEIGRRIALLLYTLVAVHSIVPLNSAASPTITQFVTGICRFLFEKLE
jgi:hypothetical protein